MTDNEVQDFAVIDFGEYFKSMKEKFYSKLCEEQNIRKVAESLHMFLTTTDKVEKYVNLMQPNSCDNGVHNNMAIILTF